jgi:hypothetical protein
LLHPKKPPQNRLHRFSGGACHKPKPILNKGLQIRENKKKKQAQKRYSIKSNQKGVIRFVEVDYPVFKRINGKNKFDRMANGLGVQVENKVYFSNDKFIFINKKRVKIKGIKDNSKISEDLNKLYNKLKNN